MTKYAVQRATVSHTLPAPRPARAAALGALAVSIVAIALVWGSPQGLFHDPIAQLTALQQHVAGRSPTFNTVVTAAPDDLRRDAYEWVTWWPPGMGLLLLPLVIHGVPVAIAVRALAAAAYLAGSLGWACWSAEFRMPQPVLLALAVALPLSHYATTPMFQYYTESFIWACTPWVLLGAASLARVWQQPARVNLLVSCVLFGLALGFLYWLKYSSVFVCGGILLFLTWLTVCERRDRRRLRALPLLSVAVPCAAIILALGAWNKFMGAPANSAAATAGWHLNWHNLSDAVGFIPLAMTDADGLLAWLFFKPGKALIHNAASLPLAAVPVGIALLWLVWRRRDAEFSLWLARSVATGSVLGTFVVWTFSSAASHEARHLAGAAIMLIPVAVQEFFYVSRRWMRQVLLAAGTVILFVPLLYGAATLGGKAFRTRGYRAGPSGFYNPNLARKDAAAVVQRLQPYASVDTVWYVCDGITAMDLPGRTMLRWADFLPIGVLARETYRSSVPIRVNLLLPPSFEQNGKGSVIRSSFPQAQQWVETRIEGAEYTLWSTALK